MKEPRVKEARCKICGKETSIKALGLHLKAHHQQGMSLGRNWERINNIKKSTAELVLNTLTPKSKQTNQVLRCLHCGKEYNNISSISSHLRTKHNKPKGVQKGIDWDYVSGEVKEVKTKNQPRILTPEIKYIDIQAIIRVPITIGQVQIMPAEFN